MCVIIFIPKGKELPFEEFESAWQVNPDGAGFAIRLPNNKIYYKRGFMKISDYYLEISKYMGLYEMMLHFRISTSAAVNEVQTHPYELNNISEIEGVTDEPVIAMNGIVSGQKEYKINKIEYNDTMSYIHDNRILFEEMSQRMVDIISEHSGAKWCVMAPNGTFCSSEFIEKNGIKYSNDNHFLYMDYYMEELSPKYNIKKLLKNKTYKNIKKDIKLLNKVNNFIKEKCNKYYCRKCTKCLNSCNTMREVKIVLNENE